MYAFFNRSFHLSFMCRSRFYVFICSEFYFLHSLLSYLCLIRLFNTKYSFIHCSCKFGFFVMYLLNSFLSHLFLLQLFNASFLHSFPTFMLSSCLHYVSHSFHTYASLEVVCDGPNQYIVSVTSSKLVFQYSEGADINVFIILGIY